MSKTLLVGVSCVAVSVIMGSVFASKDHSFVNTASAASEDSAALTPASSEMIQSKDTVTSDALLMEPKEELVSQQEALLEASNHELVAQAEGFAESTTSDHEMTSTSEEETAEEEEEEEEADDEELLPTPASEEVFQDEGAQEAELDNSLEHDAVSAENMPTSEANLSLKAEPAALVSASPDIHTPQSVNQKMNKLILSPQDSKKIGPWEVTCEDGQRGCYANQVLLDEKTGRVIAHMFVGYTPQNELMSMYVGPTGIALQHGMAIQIDKHAQRGFPVERCTPGGCMGTLPIDATFLTELQKGKKMLFGVMSPEGKTYTITFKLDQFSAALKALQEKLKQGEVPAGTPSGLVPSKAKAAAPDALPEVGAMHPQESDDEHIAHPEPQS